MKPFLRQQLARYAERLGELLFLLSREDIMKDMAQFLVLSREHTEVASVASRWARYQQREADLTAARELLSSAANDAEMTSLAQEEIDGASAELQQLETELQRMLLPKTQTTRATLSWKSARAPVATNRPCLRSQ